jgi:hypothetical protein
LRTVAPRRSSWAPGLGSEIYDRGLGVKHRRQDFAAACLAGALVAGCASVHHGGGDRVTATGHAEWVGGLPSRATEPASGISYKVLADGVEMGSGVTDTQGDFSISSSDGTYVLSASGCLDLPFTIPTHEQLTVSCPRQ